MKQKFILLIFAFFLLCSVSFAKVNTFQSLTEYRIYSVLSSLPKFWAQDRKEPQEERDIRLKMLSSSVAKAVQKYRPRDISEEKMASGLMTIAYKETRLAKNVSIGRCDLMPIGQRCDYGRAKTYFQLWKSACPEVWSPDIVPGTQQELDIAANCAARLLTFNYRRCAGKNEAGVWAGAFVGYRSRCTWNKKGEQGPSSRAKFMDTVFSKMMSISDK